MSLESLLARPQAASPDPSRRSHLLPVLGGILIGISLILFFSANWRSIPDAVKLGIIFSNLAGAYGLGYFLKYSASCCSSRFPFRSLNSWSR